MIGVFAQVDPVLFLDLSDKQVDKQPVEIIPSQMRIAIRRQNLKDPVFQFQD